MSTSPHATIVIEPTASTAEPCVLDSQTFPEGVPIIILTGDRLLVAQAMSLLIRLDQDLRQARVQFNQDWFRRVMQARRKAVSRLRRRWEVLSPPASIPLGNTRRHYHSNLARYLYEVAE